MESDFRDKRSGKGNSLTFGELHKGSRYPASVNTPTEEKLYRDRLRAEARSGLEHPGTNVPGRILESSANARSVLASLGVDPNSPYESRQVGKGHGVD